MRALFANGRIVDAILGLVAVEAVFLSILHKATGRGIRPAFLLSNLFAGSFLLGALRGGLRRSAPGLIGLALALAGVAHLVDLRLRWGRA